jgi:hypothetical protein
MLVFQQPRNIEAGAAKPTFNASACPGSSVLQICESSAKSGRLLD